jgi:hypothetical protein
MKLSFEIDENYLISNILAGGKLPLEYKKDIVVFREDAWKISRNSYDLLRGEFYPDSVSENNLKNSISFLKKTKELDSYKKLLKQTNSYKNLVEKQWNKNLKETSLIIRELTGLDLDKSLTVYITHPAFGRGRHLGGNKIAWGHNEDYPNYSTVYLWHEILHSYLEKNDLTHSIIQLVAENELKVRLNGGKYPPFEGHEKLFPIMKKLLPNWKKFLKSKDKNIIQFIKANDQSRTT